MTVQPFCVEPECNKWPQLQPQVDYKPLSLYTTTPTRTSARMHTLGLVPFMSFGHPYTETTCMHTSHTYAHSLEGTRHRIINKN